jgi:hypothetical protein
MKESTRFLFLRIIYISNILVAGAISIMTLVFNSFATKNLFGDLETESNSSYITGSFWTAITLCSIFGLKFPYNFSPVLIIQIIYKSLYLFRKFLPDLISGNVGERGTIGMSIFFLVWIIILPIFVPWRYLFRNNEIEPNNSLKQTDA